MSQLGYIQKSYGNEIKIAAANTYGYNVLSGSNLPANSLILASPISENNEDTGSYSLLITDYLSTPVRLTYTLREGSGIVYSDDSLKVKIDNDTIIEKNKELSVNVNSLIDNNTIVYEGNEVKLNINNMKRASSTTRGVFTIDEKTIKNADDELFVDTSNLNYANEDTKVPGIFIGDGKLVNVNNGIIELNEINLHKADSESFGTVIGNGRTVNINDGIISIDTENLDVCDKNPGIVKADNETIEINGDSELEVKTDKLKKCSTATAGVCKVDNKSFEMTNDMLRVKNFSIFDKMINSFSEKTFTVDDKIKDIDYLLNEYQIGMQKPEIIDFHCANLLTGVLEKPSWLNQGINDMPSQFISTDFVIATNCPFVISLKFEDNVDPAISLYQINYNTIDIYNGNSGLFETFQTTQEKQIPIKMTFICKNYYKEDKTDYSKKVKIKIIVSYAHDVTVSKSIIYSIVRFNSGYNEEIEYDETNIETYINRKGTN